MRRLIAVAATAAALAGTLGIIAPAHAADTCTGPSYAPGVNPLGVKGVDTPAGRYYIDDRNYPTGNGLWIYKESTNNTTLQRRTGTASVWSQEKDPTDAVVKPGLLTDKDNCTDVGVTATSPVDTLIF